MFAPSSPALVLAPMEGVTDAAMRALQGATGCFTYAVSEFLRVNQVAPPPFVFHRHVPELRTDSRTLSGLPVQVQLLGGDEARLAEAAVRACDLGAAGIDLNFGCPAKTVNRHDGGATLLKYPTRIRGIVRAVRSAVPATIPVSAKLRLGWDDTAAIHENAAMATDGGANWITIHARTRTQGYAPPVDWHLVGRVRESLAIPVIANGDIWTLDDFRRCQDATGCIHFMLGRGALANPHLPYQVAADLSLNPPPASLDRWLALMQSLVAWTAKVDPHFTGSCLPRMKQWLRLAAVHGTFPQFDRVKRAKCVADVFAVLGEAEPVVAVGRG